MVGGGGGSYLSSDERYSGNKSRFKVVSRSLAEEDAFDVKPLRTGVRSGVVGSIANLAKGALGGGILAGHAAYMTSGYVPGIFLNFTYGIYMCFNLYLLVLSGQRLCRRAQVGFLTYPDVGEAAFALFPNPKVARWSNCYRIWVSFLGCCQFFGSCACYQLMVGNTLKQLIENTQEISMEGKDGGPSLRVYVAIMMIPTVLICLITKIKYLAPFSLGANIVIAICIFTTIHYARVFNPHFENLVPFTTLYSQVQFTGMSVFSLSCVGAILPVENNMKEPKKFATVLFVGYAFIISAVFLASFFGYVAFTDHCETPVTINYPMEKFPQVLKAGIAVMLYITHAINFFMPFECVFYYIKKRINPNKLFVGELISRAFFVVLISCVAIAFPSINHLMGFLGCFCLSNLVFICPNTIYVMVHYDRPGWGKNRWRLWRSVALSVFGVFILICGSFVTGKQMVETLFVGKATTAAAVTVTTAAAAAAAAAEPTTTTTPKAF